MRFQKKYFFKIKIVKNLFLGALCMKRLCNFLTVFCLVLSRNKNPLNHFSSSVSPLISVGFSGKIFIVVVFQSTKNVIVTKRVLHLSSSWRIIAASDDGKMVKIDRNNVPYFFQVPNVDQFVPTADGPFFSESQL